MIETKFLANNECYISPITIRPKYIIVHSTACGYRDKDQLFKNWDGAGKLSVHGMVDDRGSYLTLPLDTLGWHVGALGNGKTVGFEICEPKNIAYANANHTKVDTVRYDPKNPEVKADFEKRYKNAVELAVYMSRQTGIPVERIVSHKEGHAMGIASNHGDPDQWWSLFGKTMDDFRADVRNALAQPIRKPNPQTGGETILYRVQCGAFLDERHASALKDKLEAAGFPAIVKYGELLYHVQCGAFSKRENAERLKAKLASRGFSCIIKREKK